MATPNYGKKIPTMRPDAAAKGGVAGARPGARAELSTIDFSGELSVALADCAGMVRVQEVGPGIGAAYEEAAVLYANGNVREAESVMEAVLAEPSTSAGEGLWMMLLDLYRLSGQRERFESRVLDYATLFERSPPPWEDLSQQAGQSRSAATPLINLIGTLSAQTQEQLQQIMVVGQRNGVIRVDLKRLRSFDEAGCVALLDTVKGLAREHAKIVFLNASGLVDMLSAQVKVGEPVARATWLLLLELLQHTGEYERFEERALDYAITFEESPPSWEHREPVLMTSGEDEMAGETSLADNTYVLEGELTNASAEVLRKLAAFASSHDSVKVECGQLRRMDFVSAGTLFNVLSTLRAQGKLVSLHNVNAMVAALLRVMGVDQVAQVMLRT